MLSRGASVLENTFMSTCPATNTHFTYCDRLLRRGTWGISQYQRLFRQGDFLVAQVKELHLQCRG